jgi:hypothetical protein
VTDQKSLSHLNEQRLHTPWQQKVFTKLLGLNYGIIYRRGVKQGSRCLASQACGCCNVVSTCQPQWLDKVVASYESDSYVKGIIAKLTLYPTFVPYFSWLNGLLKYKGRIWVGLDSELQLQLITVVEVVL